MENFKWETNKRTGKRTIIYGLIFATFLTLVVAPVMYWLAYLLKQRFVLRKNQKLQTANG